VNLNFNFISIQELGFEGVDKFACKYHDKVYDHLPAWKKKQQKQQAQDRRQHEQQQHNPPPPANEQQRARELPEEDRSINQYNDYRDGAMSSYAQSQAPSYAPDRRQDYRGYEEDRRQDYRGYENDRHGRYVQNEGGYNRGVNAGAIVMRDNEAYPERNGYEVAVCYLPMLMLSQS
jgi:hypothetical protein